MKSKNKFESNKKYFTISIYAIVVIFIGCIIFRFVNHWTSTNALLLKLWNTILPFFIGALIAYIMNPAINFFQRTIFNRIFSSKRLRLQRGFSILLAYIIFVGFIGVCIFLIVPQLYDSIVELSKKIPDIYQTITDTLNHYKNTSKSLVSKEMMTTIETKGLPKIMTFSNQFLDHLLPLIYNFSLSFVMWTYNIFIALIISIYMNTDKKILKYVIKKTIIAVYNEDHAYLVIRTLVDSHNIFSGYIIGKSLDSLIIGILCFVLMSILQLPYTVLISVFVGIFNMIPYFGPFIGAVPGVFILAIVSPYKALIFIVMIIILQQFDGLFLGPKILGNSIGVRPLMILFSITFGGAYFGPLGMFLGVPIFAVIQNLITNWINYRLYKKGEDLL